MAKNTKKTAVQQTKKKPRFLKIIIGTAVALVCAAAVVLLVINAHTENAKHVLRNTEWKSVSALNASGDEVDVREVYNVRYSQYQGKRTFDGENGFELWLRPGDPSDGTHSGKYEIDGDKANVTFDEGTDTAFALTRSEGEITRIELLYDGYTVAFVKAEPEKTE